MVPAEEEAPGETHKAEYKHKLCRYPMKKDMCYLHGREAEKAGISDFYLWISKVCYAETLEDLGGSHWQMCSVT